MIHFLILRCILMLSLVIAVAISASIIRAVSTFYTVSIGKLL